MNATCEGGDHDGDSSQSSNEAAEPFTPSKRGKKSNEKVGDGGTPKKPLLRESDALLIYIAKCIMARPDQLGVLLTSKNGKGRAQDEFINFICGETTDNDQFKGKTASREASSNWIKKGIKNAEDEAASRATNAAAGRGAPYVSVPEVSTAWFDFMNEWSEYLNFEDERYHRTVFIWLGDLSGVSLVLAQDAN